MARGHTHVLGLDIGSWAVKIAELRLTGSGIQLQGLPIVVPTPSRAVEDGVVVDPTAVRDALSEAVSIGRFDTRNVIASVGGTSSVVVRVTEVPRMTGKELEEAIQWELDRQAPFPVDQAFYDYTPIQPPDADPDSENMQVLLAVAQEDMIDAHVDTISRAKLAVQAIDIEPLAISRALISAADGRFADQTVGIVHIGASSTIILVVRRGLLNFVRTIPTAGAAMNEAISQNLDIDDEQQAEYIKHALADLSEDIFMDEEGYDVLEGEGEVSGAEETAGSADETEGAASGGEQSSTGGGPGQQDRVADMGPDELEARQVVYEAVATPIVDMANELQASLNFYRRQHRDEEVDRIILSGGSAVIPGLDDFVTAESGVVAELADPFGDMLDEKLDDTDYFREIGPAMVVAVGLGLRDMVE